MYGKTILNFVINCQIFLQSGSTIFHSHQQDVTLIENYSTEIYLCIALCHILSHMANFWTQKMDDKRSNYSVSSSCPCTILLWFLTITMIPFKTHWVLTCRWYLRLPKWERRISKRMDFYAMKLTWNFVFQFGWNFFKDVYPLIITDSVYPVPIERTMKASSMKSKDWLGNNNI